MSFFRGKYGYVALWLALAAVVAAVCAFGGRRTSEQKESKVTVTEHVIIPTPMPKNTAPPADAPEKTEKQMAGVWVPYMSLSTEEHTQAAFEENFRNIADSAKSKGLNALFVHVRPFCDALYPSKYYPWSHIVSGKQGEDPGFDPLRFMLDYTHSLGMEFHAWINPLRVKSGGDGTTGTFDLAEDNPYVVLGNDQPYYFTEYEGGIYLDPAYPYVRKLIADGCAEIAENYEVDGIHFDDYFYMDGDDPQSCEAYELYTTSVEVPLSLTDWRMANVNAMVQECYEAVKRANKNAVFGISPQGNLKNNERLGADVRTWCGVEGYVDYIIPQIYFSYDNPAMGFSASLQEWLDLPRHKELKMYIGLGLYKAGSDADKGTWLSSDDIIRRQIEDSRAAQCSGIVLYSSAYLEAEQTAAEMENAVPAIAAM